MNTPVLVEQRYQVIEKIGSGSLAIVYKAQDLSDKNKLVAVKVIYSDIRKEPLCLERLIRDFEALNSFSHDNIVNVFEFFDGDSVGYTMELIDSGNLAERFLEPFMPPPLEDVVHLLVQCSDGLSAIHKQGLIHNNIKPENVLVTSHNQLKLIDFCCSTNAGSRKDSLAAGTIDYVPPEYLLSSEVSYKTDIYALGMLSYELLTGKSPFSGKSVYDTMTKRLDSDPEPITHHRKDIPVALSTSILKALKREPEKRHETAEEFKQELLASI